MEATKAALAGKVALVAGATRGAGRGTAVALGEAGATVYCTGRSTLGRRSDYNRPEILEETAELVTAAGGKGTAVAVDHRDPAQVEALIRQIDGRKLPAAAPEFIAGLSRRGSVAAPRTIDGGH